MIIISIVVLVGYFEWTTLRSSHQALKQQSITPVASARVIRDKPVTQQPARMAAIVNPKTPASKAIVSKRPLNLSIPTISDTRQMQELNDSFPSLKQRSHDWLKKPNPKEQISYNAELIFDAKEGSSVTGGKVNIKIPFG